MRVYIIFLQVKKVPFVLRLKKTIYLLPIFFNIYCSSISYAEDLNYLKKLAIEDLMNLPVSSVSKKLETLSEATAATTIITAEDIKRLGMNSIPEILRFVPGIEVARIDANKWAISSRGFNGRFASKMLVLIDGRSVYTPLFSGVYWDVQDTLLEDVARIEVIRGSGAALWGANAVNGIINIITKSSKETQGNLVSVEAGNELKYQVSARHGGQIDETTHYRVYTKQTSHGSFYQPKQPENNDTWDQKRVGGRIDSKPTEQLSYSIQADAYISDYNNVPTRKRNDTLSEAKGAHLLFQSDYVIDPQRQFSFLAYFDHTQRTSISSDTQHNTWDIEAQYRFPLASSHEIMIGAGYRSIHDSIIGLQSFSVIPTQRTDHILNGFVQDKITLKENKLYLTLGSKIEHNDYTGIEIQPSAHLLWTPNDKNSIWATVSRATRTPARTDSDYLITSPYFHIEGNKGIESENLISYEMGYRVQVKTGLSFDMSAYFNDYDSLINVELDKVENRKTFYKQRNSEKGQAFGFEFSSKWQVNSTWLLQLNYSWLDLKITKKAGFTDTTREVNSPRNKITLLSSLSLSPKWKIDNFYSYVDELKPIDIPAYHRFDTQIRYQYSDDLDFALSWKNMFDKKHFEFTGGSGLFATEVEDSISLKMNWRF